VELDRLIADAERTGDRFVGQPFRQQLEDLGLARRQRLRERGVVVTELGRSSESRVRSRHDDGVGVHTRRRASAADMASPTISIELPRVAIAAASDRAESRRE